MLNLVYPDDLRIVPRTLWIVRWQWLSFFAWKSTTGRIGFLFPDEHLGILAYGIGLPNEPLNLRLTPIPILSIPIFLSPTSNGFLVHPWTMSLYGHTLILSHNQSGSSKSVMAVHTENLDGVPNLQRQINPAPITAFTSDIIGRTHPHPTPPRYCEMFSMVGWHKSEPICKSYRVPYDGFLT